MEQQPKDTIDMAKKVEYIELGALASGTIEARTDQQEHLELFTERVGSGEFHRPITTDVIIPARCVDGRNLEQGANPLAPNAAGGTESIFVADDLTAKRFASPDGTTLGGYENTIKALLEAELEIGGHTDSHAHDAKSGCGANDKLADIYRYIAANGDQLRALAAQLGVAVSDEAQDLIIKNAASRTQFSDGAELFSVLENNAKDEYIDHLDGEHNEVAAVINKRVGTTLDRDALKAAFGDTYEAFNVDVWSFENAARATAVSEDEVAQKIIAMTYYNLATTMVLAGPRMRVIVLN